MPTTSAQTPSPAVVIHLTHSFAADVDTLHQTYGHQARTVLQRLTSALESLKRHVPPGTLPIAPYGSYGDSFSYVLDDEFAFTYRVNTDRDAERKPLTVHYYLKNLVHR